jgi:hypothetical protein
VATTFTPNAGLPRPAYRDRNWHLVANALIDQLDTIGGIGPLAVQAKEAPSSTLNVKVAAGRFAGPGGTFISYGGSASFAIASAATEKVWLTTAGTLTKGANWPTTPHVPLATVTTDASKVTAIVDERVAWASVGGGTGAAITQTYSTAATTLPAYTPDAESSAYTGAADSEAKLADLNALRVAYETLRAHAEATAKVLNAVVDELQTRGILG